MFFLPKHMGNVLFHALSRLDSPCHKDPLYWQFKSKWQSTSRIHDHKPDLYSIKSYPHLVLLGCFVLVQGMLANSGSGSLGARFAVPDFQCDVTLAENGSSNSSWIKQFCGRKAGEAIVPEFVHIACVWNHLHNQVGQHQQGKIGHDLAYVDKSKECVQTSISPSKLLWTTLDNSIVRHSGIDFKDVCSQWPLTWRQVFNLQKPP